MAAAQEQLQEAAALACCAVRTAIKPDHCKAPLYMPFVWLETNARSPCLHAHDTHHFVQYCLPACLYCFAFSESQVYNCLGALLVRLRPLHGGRG